jgi:anti-sigma regulatory factor (Ser/Thr protein kinase)
VSITTLAPAAIEPGDSIVFNPITPDDVPTARHHVYTGLAGTPFPAADNAALVVTELLANTIQHGRPRVTLTIRQAQDGIEITITDEGLRDTPVDDRPADEHGLGLIIARALTEHLTIQSNATGTTVRATLRNPKDTDR